MALLWKVRSGHFRGGDTAILLVLSEAPFVLVGLWRVRRNLKLNLVSDEVFTGDLKRGLAAGLLTGGGILLAGIGLISLLAKTFGSQNLPRVLEEMLAGTTGWRAAIVVSVIAVLGPIAEELFFRAGMFAPLYSSGRFWLGALLSSALFSLAHMNLLLSPYYFVLGIVLCGVFAATRNLVAPMVAHITLNATACAVFLLQRPH